MRRLTLVILFISISLHLHAAREVYSLNDGWRFFFAAENSGDNAREVNIPHTWDNSTAFMVAGGGSVANYIRRFTPPAEWRGKRIFLKFYGVQREANIFINGKHCGEHRGGATAFVLEVSKMVDYGESNLINVLVSSAPQSDLLPTSFDHNIDGGIYRDVEIIVTDRDIISPLYYGSSGLFFTPTKITDSRSEGYVDLHLDIRSAESRKLFVRILDPEGVVVFKKTVSGLDREDTQVRIPFSLRNSQLWSPASPALYTVVATLFGDDSEDEVVITSGLRHISIAEQGLLRLNDEPTVVRGVGLYHDAPIVGSALRRSDYDFDIDVIKELGANALHSAVVPHDRYLYQQCDKLGVMAWVDFPLSLSPFLSDIGYLPTERFKENGRQQIREIVLQNYNHPSVVMWGLFSRLSPKGDDFIPYLEELKAMVRELDPQRPIVALSDQNGNMNNIPDGIVWRQNIGWDRGALSDIGVWRTMLHEKWSQLRSAVCYGEGGSIEHQGSADRRRIMAQSWYPEARQRHFHEEYAAMLTTDSLFWGQWLSSLFDYRSSRSALGENVSGLVSFDRRSRKDVFYLYKALWNSAEPTLHIAGKREGQLVGSSLDISVYASDTTAVSLRLGRDTMQLERYAPAQYRAKAVELTAPQWIVAMQGELRDSIYVVPRSPLRQQL